jgi:hypothetical protein
MTNRRLTLLFACSFLIAWMGASSQTSRPGEAMTGGRVATQFPGASIVEQVQAAIRDCGGNPCQVNVPAGTYDASPIATWKARDFSGAAIGIPLPSNVTLRGAGQGITVIRVKRQASDPVATLLANAAVAARNLRIHDLSFVWEDSAASYNWASIFICHQCQDVELDHLTFEGNPNKLVNLLDSTNSSVHDCDFRMHPTGYGHGDNALSFSRFDPAATVRGPAGVVRDNRFGEIGSERTFSMLVVCQSGLYVHDNVFEANLPASYGTAIESGQDNMGRLPEDVKLSANFFHGTSIAYGGMSNSEISNNRFDHGDIYMALQSGNIASLAGLSIADNELRSGSISIGGLEHTFTGRILIARNRVFDGNIGTGNALVDGDIEVIGNDVRYSRNKNGIDCNSCSIIRGNVVREIGQNGPGDLHAGYGISGNVADVSDNLYLDEQHDYDGGTICSVASPSSQTCMASGSSRWIRLNGGAWAFGWTNRTLFTQPGNLTIHAFVSESLIELDHDIATLSAGTKYQLHSTTFNGFELNAATIGRFANNTAMSAAGFRNAAIQEDGTVRIRGLYGNVFQPYKCVGKCAVNYSTSMAAPN